MVVVSCRATRSWRLNRWDNLTKFSFPSLSCSNWFHRLSVLVSLEFFSLGFPFSVFLSLGFLSFSTLVFAWLYCRRFNDYDCLVFSIIVPHIMRFWYCDVILIKTFWKKAFFSLTMREYQRLTLKDFRDGSLKWKGAFTIPSPRIRFK